MSDACFTVDPDELNTLSTRLGEAVDGLQGMGVTLTGYQAADLGPDQGVWRALSDFADAWTSHLKATSSEVSALQKRLTSAATGYQGTEDQIGQAATAGQETIQAATPRVVIQSPSSGDGS
jgi:hypothetical protein